MPANREVGSRVSQAPAVDVGVSEAATSDGPVSERSRVFVRFTGDASGTARARFRRSIGAKVLHAYRLVPGLQLLEVATNNAAARVRSSARAQRSTVRYAVPDFAYRVQALPDDPLYSEQWGMASIDAPQAWEHSTGSKKVVVAVLDTGIDLEHPDLNANIWTNPNPGRYGYTGDAHGWNFIENNNDPNDDYGHGTHVAGIIGAVGDNATGVTGVNWSVSLMPLKICNKEGLCEASAEIAALEYAVEHGAKIANASFGAPGGGYQPEEEAIRNAGKAGLLYVAGAGNQASNNDGEPFYPASYPLENIISVTASTPSETLAEFANFGADSVALAAPGENILSTLPLSGGRFNSPTGYGLLSGTSMAAPQVAGAAALLWSQHPSWTMQQIRARILRSTRIVPALFGKVSSCGELDVGAATNLEVTELAPLCVTRSGSGSGSVSSSPAGLQCGTNCAEKVQPGAEQTLTATPAAGSTFAGWSGACTGTAPCVVAPSLGATVTARFDARGAPAGWQERTLATPSEREAFLPGSVVGVTFYNVSLSADGAVRAKTIFDEHENDCQTDSDTGGVFIEHDTPSGWISDGRLTAPALGSSGAAHWANCSYYGALTTLAGNGSTLLVASEMKEIDNDNYRCAAFVYRHEGGHWKLDGTLFPPGVGVEGSPSLKACDYFGFAGAISDNGDTVAIRATSSIAIFTRTPDAGWTLAQDIALPEGSGCQESRGPRQLAMSGQGTSILVGDPSCSPGIQQVGRVYAYLRRPNGDWAQTQIIDAPEQQLHYEFGSSVAISDDGHAATVRVRANAIGANGENDAAWVLARVGERWQAEQRLTDPLAEAGTGLECPAIIDDGLRIICAASDAVGLDAEQGILYIFERPPAGWSAPVSAPMSMFASEGAAGDRLGNAGYEGWSSLTVAADGSLIDATISPMNLANHLYTDSRIGYEFAAPMPPAPTISGLSVTAGTVSSEVTVTGANLQGTTRVDFGGAEASDYRIDSSTQITATVPENAKSGLVSVTTRAGTATSSEPFTVLASISTTASPTVAQGEAIWDTAVLLGGSSPTGTIGFQLYAAADTECHRPLLAEPLTVSVTGDGHYTTPSSPWTTPGRYQWLASYSGDANNPSATDACGEPGEQVTVQARPSLVVNASSPVPYGEPGWASGSLSGGSAPTGTIGFQLYAAADTECRQPLLGESLRATVTEGNGTYSTPAPTHVNPGAYRWVASYSGDTLNTPATSACDQPGAQFTVQEQRPRPAVLSESVLQQAPTDAVLSGTIDPAGQPAGYHFEYGTSESYGISTPDARIAAGQSEVAAGPVPIGELQPEVTYHYRLVAENTTGVTYGADQTFTTPGRAPAPVIQGVGVPFLLPTSIVGETAAFSGLSLHLARNRRALVLEIAINASGSKLTLKATAPLASRKHSKRAARLALVASLSRASIPAGPLVFSLPLSSKARRTLRHRSLEVKVKIVVSPPAGRPGTVIDALTL